MNRPQCIIIRNDSDQMYMVRHDHISVNLHRKMRRDILHNRLDDLTAGGQPGFGRFVNRPYEVTKRNRSDFSERFT